MIIFFPLNFYFEDLKTSYFNFFLKEIQKNIEEQQKKVDSLQNMVVVVDDNNTESGKR